MKRIFLLFSVILIVVFSAAFVTSDNTADEKQCTVYVKWYSSSGSPAKGKKVVGYTSTRTLSTEGTNIAYTNDNGKVTLTWDSYKDLCVMYVDGVKHEGTWRDGGSYTFVLD